MKNDFFDNEEIRKILILFDFSNFISTSLYTDFFNNLFKNPYFFNDLKNQFLNLIKNSDENKYKLFISVFQEKIQPNDINIDYLFSSKYNNSKYFKQEKLNFLKKNFVFYSTQIEKYFFESKSIPEVQEILDLYLSLFKNEKKISNEKIYNIYIFLKNFHSDDIFSKLFIFLKKNSLKNPYYLDLFFLDTQNYLSDFTITREFILKNKDIFSLSTQQKIEQFFKQDIVFNLSEKEGYLCNVNLNKFYFFNKQKLKPSNFLDYKEIMLNFLKNNLHVLENNMEIIYFCYTKEEKKFFNHFISFFLSDSYQEKSISLFFDDKHSELLEIWEKDFIIFQQKQNLTQTLSNSEFLNIKKSLKI